MEGTPCRYRGKEETDSGITHIPAPPSHAHRSSARESSVYTQGGWGQAMWGQGVFGLEREEGAFGHTTSPK